MDISKESTTVYEEVISSLGSSTVVTKGNHSFISIQYCGDPADHAESLLEIVQTFELKHPELEVTSFDIEKQQSARGTNPFIFGLWLHHHPRHIEKAEGK